MEKIIISGPVGSGKTTHIRKRIAADKRKGILSIHREDGDVITAAALRQSGAKRIYIEKIGPKNF